MFDFSAAHWPTAISRFGISFERPRGDDLSRNSYRGRTWQFRPGLPSALQNVRIISPRRRNDVDLLLGVSWWTKNLNYRWSSQAL